MYLLCKSGVEVANHFPTKIHFWTEFQNFWSILYTELFSELPGVSVQHLRNCFIIMNLKSSAAVWYYKLKHRDRNYTCIPQGTKCSVQGTSLRERQRCVLDWASLSSESQSDCNSRELGWQQSLTLRQQQNPKGYNFSASFTFST